MTKVEIHNPSQINELEALLVQDYMQNKYPDLYGYTMTAGNDCVWVYWGSTLPMNLYFVFKDGKISYVDMD